MVKSMTAMGRNSRSGAFRSLFPIFSVDLYSGVLILTQSGVKHVECHLIALGSARNSHQSLVAVVLWLVDLDHTPTQLSDFVDLGSSFADDCPYHVVRDEDLLG